jgi:hypothetical protein
MLSSGTLCQQARPPAQRSSGRDQQRIFTTQGTERTKELSQPLYVIGTLDSCFQGKVIKLFSDKRTMVHSS